MKKLLALILSISFQLISAQDVDNPKPTLIENEDPEGVYKMSGIDVKPEFIGGMAEFYRYVSKNFRLPDHPDLKSGKIFVSFVIEKDGSTTDVKVIRDIGFGTGEEAMRVVKNSPKWNPGVQNGKAVRVMYSLPISITIPEPANLKVAEPKK